MKSWLHNHRVRRQRSDSQLLPIQKHGAAEVQEIVPMRPLPTPIATTATVDTTAARIAASKTSSRMSIERYLNAPLEEEAASLPAINAALQDQTSQPVKHFHKHSRISHHSRESSWEVNSDGRRTFYTSGSAAESTGTSYSVASKSARGALHHQRSNTHISVPELPKIHIPEQGKAEIVSPEQPTTNGTIDQEKVWAEEPRALRSSQGQLKTDYKQKAQEEIARIQERARQLEEKLLKYRDEEAAQEPISTTSVTDEQAYAQMARHSKLAWILGGDATDVKHIERPRSSGSVVTGVSDHSTRPTSSGTVADPTQFHLPRRSKSNGALDAKKREAMLGKRSAGLFAVRPSKRARFFCTFCQKRFHSRLEWQRHEQTIHMPEELWVCCPRTGDFPARCPFCAKRDPSPSHLADHNYFSCQEKPLSERTFDRQDFFLQHIAQEHRVSAGQKPIRLAELLEAWKHPLPLKQGHQALHCGFCGLTFLTYKERTEHVGKHFLEGVDMMAWWDGRVNHDVADPKGGVVLSANPDLPHRCMYCARQYGNLAAAQKLHPLCSMWSCSFLPGLPYTIYPTGSGKDVKASCCYCNESLVNGAGKVKGSVLKGHVSQHNFRNCNQRLYFSAQRFRQHLQDSHKTTHDGSLSAGWTLLLKSSRNERTSLFEPVPTSTAVQRAYTDPGYLGEKKGGKRQKREAVPSLQKLNFMDLSETTSRPLMSRKKLQRKDSAQTLPDKPAQELRNSTHFFSRAATIELARGAADSPSPRLRGLLSPKLQPPQHKPGFQVASLPIDVVNSCPRFYRRRLDGSPRNRLYIQNGNDGPLSKSSQKLFKKVQGSLVGSLVLHSSLAAAVPVKMTNSVDIYSLH